MPLRDDFLLTAKRPIIGSSRKIMTAIAAAEKCALTKAPCLITAEPGTEILPIAKVIHGNRTGQLDYIDCSGYEDFANFRRDLFENFMLMKYSAIEFLRGGTIVLKNVDSLNHLGQQILSAFVDHVEREAIDLKIVCTTTKGINQKLKSGKFLESLYFRISVIAFSIPSLSERPSDIPAYIKHFSKKVFNDSDRKCEFSSEAIELMTRLPWTINLITLEAAVVSLICDCHTLRLPITPDDVINNRIVKLELERKPRFRLKPAMQVEA